MSEENLFHMRKIITMALMKIGIRCDLNGFNYLCYAIELVILEPELLHDLCKGLYVKVGEKFHVKKVANVERNIRHAIENTYVFQNFGKLNKLMGFDLFTVNDKPTAGELIRLIAEYYNLGLYKD